MKKRINAFVAIRLESGENGMTMFEVTSTLNALISHFDRKELSFQCISYGWFIYWTYGHGVFDNI